MNIKAFGSIIIVLGVFTTRSYTQTPYHEMYRPQIHFSPKEKWTNDPNGMVYYNGTYHLFFQYYPDSTVWGPMHWGHATSTDLVHWQQQPIALYPDSLGYIFSGSAVVDKNNTSGFGKNGQAPLVAIFTHHDPAGERSGSKNFQNQSLAYSLDNGKTWIKYAGNPVLRNPGITDFRDPKVMWYEPQKKWVMTLAVKDHITFYSSPDLKNWTKESEFGKAIGAHGGVWECPDLFTLDDNARLPARAGTDGNNTVGQAKKVWVLIVNINPGGPNGGSATQYFPGDFDGKTFTPADNATRWLDYGPDEYAGISWSNTGDRKIFLGWMSNWLYANVVPTVKWRNAMTLPRELKIKHAGNDIFIASQPVAELNKISSGTIRLKDIQVDKGFDLSAKTGKVKFPCRLDLNFEKTKDFSLILSNDIGEKLIIGYDKKQNQYFIDRTASGKVDFQKEFAGRHVAPRLVPTGRMDVSMIFDVSSVELFADDGLTVMTEIFFPAQPYDRIRIQSEGMINKLDYSGFNSIWH